MTEGAKLEATGSPSDDGGPSSLNFKLAALPLAERLVRLLCYVGLAVAGVSLVRTLAPIFLFPEEFLRLSRYSLRTVAGWSEVAELTVGAVAAGFLVAGAVGELKRQPWARRALVAYVLIWLLGAVMMAGTQVAHIREMSESLNRPDGAWTVAILANVASTIVVAGAYPLILAACLSWPEIKRSAEDSRASFPVLSIGPVVSE